MVILIVCSIVPLFPAEAGLYVANPKVQLRDTPLSGPFQTPCTPRGMGFATLAQCGNRTRPACVSPPGLPLSHDTAALLKAVVPYRLEIMPPRFLLTFGACILTELIKHLFG